MRHPGVLLALGTVLLSGLVAWGPSAARADEPAVHEDGDYRFRIRSPGPGWRLLPEADARRLAPDAIAGMANLRGESYVVIVEQAPSADLDACVQALRDGVSLEDVRRGEVESLVYLGLPARRWTTDGRNSGMEVRFRHLAFLRDGYLHQLVGYALRSRPGLRDGPPALDVLDEHFSLVEGPIRPRSQTQAQHDMTGIGWRVRQGLYEDAAHALAWKPPAGWRLAVGDELREMNDSACVGIVTSDPEAYAVVIVEPARGMDAEAFLERARATVAQAATPSGEVTKLVVGGHERAFRSHALSTGVGVRLSHAAFMHGERAVQVQWWALDGLVERSRPRVAEALATLRLLDGPRTAALARELAGGRDPQERVGLTFCLRAGVYRDFELDFTWTKPAGHWTVACGAEARAENEDAILYLEELSEGLHGMLIMGASDGADAATFHARLVDGLEPTSPPEAAAAVALPGAEALVSELVSLQEGLPVRYVVASVLRDGRVYELFLWGLEGNAEAARPALAAAVRGLAFPERLVAEERRDGAHVDHRLGFRWRKPPGDGWRFAPTTPPQVAAVASFARYQHRQGMAMACAFCALQAEQDERFVRDMMLQILREHAGSSDGEPVESVATVAGLPAKRLVLPGPGTTTAWILSRGRTFYFLLFDAAAGLDLGADEVPGLFELLD